MHVTKKKDDGVSVRIRRDGTLVVRASLTLDDKSKRRTQFSFFSKSGELFVTDNGARRRPAAGDEITIFRNAVSCASEQARHDREIAECKGRPPRKARIRETRFAKAAELVESALA